MALTLRKGSRGGVLVAGHCAVSVLSGIAGLAVLPVRGLLHSRIAAWKLSAPLAQRVL